jgi:hypothetical protein
MFIFTQLGENEHTKEKFRSVVRFSLAERKTNNKKKENYRCEYSIWSAI